MTTMAPGIRFTEGRDTPSPRAPDGSLSGIVIRAERGPDDRAVLIDSVQAFRSVFGKASSTNPYGYECVAGYLAEQGGPLYVVRAVGADATKASKALASLDTTNATVATITAAYGGAAVNADVLTVEKYTLTSTSVMADNANTIVVDNVSAVEVGDVVRVYHSALVFTTIVTAVNVSTKTLTLRNATTEELSVGAIVTCTSTHKVRTTLAADITGSATQLQLSSGAELRVGQLLLVISSGRCYECRITAVNGSLVNVATVYADGSGTISAGAPVVSIGFDLAYTSQGQTFTHRYMTLESADAVDYIVPRLAETIQIRGSLGTLSPSTWRSFLYPGVHRLTAMASGTDGTSPTAGEILGTSAKTYTHGLRLFDGTPIFRVGVTDTSATVVRGLATYCAERSILGVYAFAETADTLDELTVAHRSTNNVDSSDITNCAPWGYEEDVLNPGSQIAVPPVGRQMGMMARVARERGLHKPPANETVGFLGLKAHFTEAQHAILNDLGINLMLAVPGKGIRVMGARTSSSGLDRKRFTNVRNVINGTMLGLRSALDPYVFEPSDETTWANIRRAMTAYLSARHGEGWYVPKGVPSKAYFVSCGPETMTQEDLNEARIVAIFGINPVTPGEVILFKLTMMNGALTLTQ